ncbi:MAG TPA: hypothetical protein VJL58_11125 [Pyrinomonadaceae bacterium]|nr:hypothetical protein [Pyrinomonadaceae bacterium]
MRFSPAILFLSLAFATLALAQTPTIEEFLSKKLDDKFCAIRSDALLHRIFSEYGAIYVADSRVALPNQCLFANEGEVAAFQKTARTMVSYIGRAEIELQEAAMTELLNAVVEAEARNKRITPLDGSIAGKRSFNETGRLWNSRFHRALDHWVSLGRIDEQISEAFRWQPFRKQAEQVIKWEAENIFFSTNFSQSIFSSTAPPGASQHLTMLAFDVAQYSDPEIRRILNDHGWYQTIVSDAPHFTFLGLKESELPQRGLKNVMRGSHSYWVPNTATVLKPFETAAK